MRKEVFLNPNIMGRRQDWRNRSTVPISQDNLELDMLLNRLESLAEDVVAFISCLDEFEEFNGETISQSMGSFRGDLRVRRIPYSFPLVSHVMFDRSASRLVLTSTKVRALSQLMCAGYIVFLDQFRSSAVQWYVHDLMHELGGHLDEITLALPVSHMTGNILSESVNMHVLDILIVSQCGHTLASYPPFTEPLLGSCSRSPWYQVPWWLLV